MLSSVLKKHGHQTDTFITSEEKDYYRAVLDFRPDVVAIYATTGQHEWPYPNMRRWKKELRHLKVVIGGPHPSHDLEPLPFPDVDIFYKYPFLRSKHVRKCTRAAAARTRARTARSAR